MSLKASRSVATLALPNTRTYGYPASIRRQTLGSLEMFLYLVRVFAVFTNSFPLSSMYQTGVTWGEPSLMEVASLAKWGPLRNFFAFGLRLFMASLAGSNPTWLP